MTIRWMHMKKTKLAERQRPIYSFRNWWRPVSKLKVGEHGVLACHYHLKTLPYGPKMDFLKSLFNHLQGQ